MDSASVTWYGPSGFRLAAGGSRVLAAPRREVRRAADADADLRIGHRWCSAFMNRPEPGV